MKDLISVKNAIKEEKDFYSLHKVDNCVNAALAQLWGDENVVKAMVGKVVDSSVSIYLLTDKNRLIVCNESGTERKGWLLDTTEYSHSAYAYEMKGVDANKTRCVTRDVGGFFGKRYFDVIFEGQAYPPKLTLTFADGQTANAVKQAVLDNDKKCNAPSPEVKNTKIPVSPEPPAAANSPIAEIRKMYEDGLIDKTEMIDLIKSLNK